MKLNRKVANARVALDIVVGSVGLSSVAHAADSPTATLLPSPTGKKWDFDDDFFKSNTDNFFNEAPLIGLTFQCR